MCFCVCDIYLCQIALVLLEWFDILFPLLISYIMNFKVNSVLSVWDMSAILRETREYHYWYFFFQLCCLSRRILLLLLSCWYLENFQMKLIFSDYTLYVSVSFLISNTLEVNNNTFKCESYMIFYLFRYESKFFCAPRISELILRPASSFPAF